jgi:hypothetical protein
MTESMTNLQEAIKVVEEIEQDELAAPTEAPMMSEPPVDTPPPSEPPVDDSAIGADTEGNVVLQLLADIKDLLTQLVAVEDDDAELPPDEGDDVPVDALPEPPEGGEEDAGEEEDEDEELEPKGAPVPPE